MFAADVFKRPNFLGKKSVFYFFAKLLKGSSRKPLLNHFYASLQTTFLESERVVEKQFHLGRWAGVGWVEWLNGY